MGNCLRSKKQVVPETSPDEDSEAPPPRFSVGSKVAAETGGEAHNAGETAGEAASGAAETADGARSETAGEGKRQSSKTSDRGALRISAKVDEPLMGDRPSRVSTRAIKNDQSGGGPASGQPFPKRPMGSKLSTKAWAKIEEFFRLMDQDGSNAVTREEARHFFTGAFAQLSVDAMFNEVDTDGSGAITSEEFIEFWLQVRSSGYKEQDILDELEMLIEGAAWVDWKDGRNTAQVEVKFPKRPILCRLSAGTWAKCAELFHKIADNDEKMRITREKAQHFFKGGFSTISADAMFNEIDVDHHGVITPKEFMRFWVNLRSHGYKDKQISEELDSLMDGSAWVDWKDGRRT